VIRRFLFWLGYIPTWFTAQDFERKVGHPPCARCLANGSDPLILCERDIDAWFDAVLA
jgi:hypothetical protein